MLTLQWGEKGEIVISGRWDASQSEKADAFFKGVSESKTVDCGNLEYISSAGLGILLMAQKRLKGAGGGLVLTHLTSHVLDVLHYAGMDKIFEIVKPSP